MGASKKEMKKSLSNLKKVNYASTQFIEHIKQNYVFLSEEEKQIDNLRKYLEQLQFFFNDLEKGIK